MEFIFEGKQLNEISENKFPSKITRYTVYVHIKFDRISKLNNFMYIYIIHIGSPAQFSLFVQLFIGNLMQFRGFVYLIQ